MMHVLDIVRALLHGVPGSSEPWGRGKVKFICPSPGYDRHFAICEHHGIEMLTVGINDDGPDMACAQELGLVGQRSGDQRHAGACPSTATPPALCRRRRRTTLGCDESRRARLSAVLGQRLRRRCTTCTLRATSSPTCSPRAPRRATRIAPSCSVRRPRSRSRAPAWPRWLPARPTWRDVKTPQQRSRPSGRTRSTSCVTCASSKTSLAC